MRYLPSYHFIAIAVFSPLRTAPILAAFACKLTGVDGKKNYLLIYAALPPHCFTYSNTTLLDVRGTLDVNTVQPRPVVTLV
jgi:hypothetical protein